jgi:ribosomal protein S18 acetylase RimI-like enzyme
MSQLKPAEHSAVVLRYEPRPDDGPAVRRLIEATGMFTPAEVAVAVELVDERLARGAESGYQFVFADAHEQAVGYTCFGHIAVTQASYDLYWIAVDPAWQRRRLGSRLLTETERLIAEHGGQRVYIETSGRPQYRSTRGFYLRHGYVQEAELADFYAPGDARVIYVKDLRGGPDRPHAAHA